MVKDNRKCTEIIKRLVKMEIHNRLMNISTSGLSVLDILIDNPERKSSMIRELIEACEKEIHSGATDLKILEIFRMILGYEYQLLIKSWNNDSPLESNQSLYVDVRRFFVKDMDYCPSRDEFNLLYDIAVLQLTLRSNEQQILKSFKDLYCTQREILTKEEKSKNLCMRIYECMADSYNLYSYLYGTEEKHDKDFEEMREGVLSTIESWMKQKEKLEWRLLTSLLPKLIAMFETQNILTPLWDRVLNDADDLGKTLATLCVMSDVCFPNDKTNVCQTLYQQCVQEKFWSILAQGIVSTMYQERKQAIYLMNRALDFIESHAMDMRNVLETSKNNIVPFVLTDLPSGEPLLDPSRANFFSILEVLEEKHMNLVLPILENLPGLVQALSEQKSRKSGFNFVWLQCVFKRILQHDSITIKLLGLREILQADLDIYDEDFMNFLSNSLNNILLYEYSMRTEERPAIVKQLEDFFLRSEMAQITLINNFIQSISRVSWCPVAIYWILRALLQITEEREIVYNVWTAEVLTHVKSLLETNFTKVIQYSRVMEDSEKFQLKSQGLVSKVFCAYTRPNTDWSNVELIFDTLLLCIENTDIGALDCVCQHLSLIIKSSDAQSYVIRMCGTLQERNIKSYAMGIRLLIESRLICNTRDCRAERALLELFECLNGADLRPFADFALIVKVIEFMCSLLKVPDNFELEYRKTINRLLWKYVDPIVRIIDRNFVKTEIFMFSVYATALKTIANYTIMTDCFPWWPDKSKGIQRFADKCIHIISNPRDFSQNQCSYALKILDVCWEQIFYLRSGIVAPESDIMTVLTYLKNCLLNGHENDTNDDSKKKFIMDCTDNVAKLMYTYMRGTLKEKCPSNIRGVYELQLLLENGSDEVIDPVTCALCNLQMQYPFIAEDREIVIPIIRRLWQRISQLKKLDLLDFLVDKFLLCSWHAPREIAIEVLNLIIREGVPIIKHSVAVRMFRPGSSKTCFKEALVSCLLHDGIEHHEQRIEQAAVSHSKSGIHGPLDIHMSIRALAISYLHFLLPEETSDIVELRSNVLQDLIEILEKNLQSRDKLSRKEYLENSQLHIQLHRVMQILLIMEPYLNAEETQVLWRAISNRTIAECDQPSVRFIQEWLLERINPNGEPRKHDPDTCSPVPISIWDFFEAAVKKHPGSIVSIVKLLCVAPTSLDICQETKIDFIAKAISFLLRNCKSDKLNVRFYSQAVLVKIYEMLPDHSQEADKYREIYEAIKANLGKNSTKVLNDLYLTISHQVEVPTFTFLENPDCFVDDALQLNEWGLQIIYCELCLEDEVPGIKINTSDEEAWITWEVTKFLKQSSRTTGDLCKESDPSDDNELSDVRMEIPRKSIIPLHDELSDKLRSILSRQMKNDEEGIIVVTSLTDRLKYAEYRKSQSHSESAEKWIKITEFNPHLLQNYLHEKQSAGWNLVGAEQTANSKDFLDMELDKKTIFLLGNKKNGIPVNLIPIMDTYVNIP